MGSYAIVPVPFASAVPLTDANKSCCKLARSVRSQRLRSWSQRGTVHCAVTSTKIIKVTCVTSFVLMSTAHAYTVTSATQV